LPGFARLCPALPGFARLCPALPCMPGFALHARVTPHREEAQRGSGEARTRAGHGQEGPHTNGDSSRSRPECRKLR
jgi:hypothetical protein